MSVIVEITEALVTELNDATSPIAGLATAQRHYRPTFDLREMKDLHVTVVPRGMDMAGASRSLTQSDVQIDIGVQQKLGTTNQAEIDTLMVLVDEIVGFLRGRRLAGATWALWVRTENSPIYAPDHLEQMRQFTSLLTLTYRVMQ